MIRLIILICLITMTSCSKSKTNYLKIGVNEIGVSYDKDSLRLKLGRVIKQGTYEIPITDSVLIYNVEMKASMIEEIVVPIDNGNEFIKFNNVRYRYSPDRYRIDSLDLSYGPDYHENMIIPEIKRSLLKTIDDMDIASNGNININEINLRTSIRLGKEIDNRYCRLEFFSIESYDEYK